MQLNWNILCIQVYFILGNKLRFQLEYTKYPGIFHAISLIQLEHSMYPGFFHAIMCDLNWTYHVSILFSCYK